MNGDLLTLIVVAVTVLVLVIAETHIAFVTLALCTGYVLTQFAGPELYELISGWVDPNQYPVYEAVNVSLLLIPALLVGIRFRRTQRGIKRLIEQLIPGLAFALLLAVFLIDIAPPQVTEGVQEKSYVVTTIENFSVWLVIFAIATSMFDVLIKHANEPIRRKRGPGRPPKK